MGGQTCRARRNLEGGLTREACAEEGTDREGDPSRVCLGAGARVDVDRTARYANEM